MIRYVITAVGALTIGVVAGISLTEVTTHRAATVDASHAEQLAQELAEHEQVVQAAATDAMRQQQTIATRDARISELKRELDLAQDEAERLTNRLAEKSREARGRIAELEGERAAPTTDEEIIRIGQQQDRQTSRLAGGEQHLRLVGSGFRGEHPVAGGPYTITQVQFSRRDAKWADLLFEVRNDSGEHQEWVVIQIDLLDEDGNLVERKGISFHNWPPDTLRSDDTFTEHPHKLYELRISE